MLALVAIIAALLTARTGRADIESIAVLEDPSGSMTLDDVLSVADRFVPTDRTTNAGFTDSAYWLRVTLALDGDAWLLELAYAQADHVQLFVPEAGGWRHLDAGDALPFDRRDVRHPRFIFRLPRVDGRMSVYLRAATSGPLLMPVRLWRSAELFDHIMDEQLLLGGYFAFLLALAAYNLLILITTARDRSYLFYSAYLILFVLFQAALEGHAFMYLWPDSPAWATKSAFTFLAMSVTCGLLFSREITNQIEFTPWLYRAMGYLAWAVAAAVPLLWLQYRAAGVIIVVLTFVAIVITIPTAMVRSVRRGYGPARYSLIGYACIVPGAMLMFLRQFELVDSSFVVDQTLKIGTVAEALFDSFALAYRIRMLVREKAEAERRFARELVEAQDGERRRIASELHDGVAQSLAVIVGQLQRMDAHDAAEMTQQVAREVRSVAHGLHPDKLDRLGLAAAIEAITVEMLGDIDHDSAIAYDRDALDAQAELHLYRIAQEALGNIVKHAGAKHVTVSLTCDAGHVVLRIVDDGSGMGDSPRGFGHDSIAHRTRLLGGTMSLTDGAGVSLEVAVPIQSSSSPA